MHNNKMHRLAFSGIKWSTIGTFCRAIFQLLQISILTRFLPKEAFGLVAMALFVINFTNIFVDMGFTSAILNRQNASNKEYNSVFWFNMFLSIILFLLLLILSPFISLFYDQHELTKILPILGFNLIFLAFGRVHRTILQKEFRFKQISIVDIISGIIGTVLAVILAIFGYGVYSLIYSTLIASLISSCMLILFNNSVHPINFYFNFKELKPYFNVGSYAMGSQIVSFFSTDIDILIIGKILGPTQLGLYSLSKQFILKLYSIINPIVTNVLSPLLSSIQNDKTKIKKYYLKILKILSAINIPIYLLIAVLSSEILTIFYGYGYSEARIILSFLSLVYCINSINNPLGSLQIATGRTDIGLKWAIVSLIITPIVIYFSALIDINMVVISRAILSLVMIIPIWFIQLRPMINISLKEYLIVFYKPLMLFLIVILLMCFMENKNEIYEFSLLNSIFKTIITLIAYVFFDWFFDGKSLFKIFNLCLLNVKKHS